MIFSSLDCFPPNDLINFLNLEMSINLISLGNLNSLNSFVSVVLLLEMNHLNGKTERKSIKNQPL